MDYEYNDSLFQLLEKAKHDNKIVKKILDTKKSKDPMSKLCEVATELGFPVTVGDIFQCGEEYLCNLSDSRMGVTEPIKNFGDTYEQFMASIEGLQ